MSKGKRIRAKIHRSLREARDKEVDRQKEIDEEIRLANLRPERFEHNFQLDEILITKEKLKLLDKFLKEQPSSLKTPITIPMIKK